MSLNLTQVNIGVNSGETVSFGGVTESPGFSDTVGNGQLTNGTGNLQAQHPIYGTITPATSGGTVYDLNNGTSAGNLPQGLDGLYRAYTGIKWIKIENTDPVNSVTLQGGAANAWPGVPANGSPITLNPGDVWTRYCPNTAITVSSSLKTMLMIASGGTPAVKISVIGIGA